jgi:lipopolysaccharide/colanic/teichoic acid biosynthesis glycosyltransferase
VGTDENTKELIKKMKSYVHVGYELVGLVSLSAKEMGKEINGLRVVSSLNNLDKYVGLERINQVIFSTHNISYESIIQTMSCLDNQKVSFKMAPENLEVIIGKSTVERLTDYPLVDIDYAIGKTFNKLIKKVFDIVISGILLMLTIPIWSIYLLFHFKQKGKVEIWDTRGERLKIFQSMVNPLRGFTNYTILMIYIFMGTISFVGAPLRQISEKQPKYLYKPGLMGLVQINQGKITSPDENEVYDLFYLKNQNFWLDIEIILKTFIAVQKRKKR